jgi:Holliday junction DNA helicase RuvA
MLMKIPGVGRKTAERLIIEMRDRIEGQKASPQAAGRPLRPDARSEAFDALVALGYKPQEVKRLIGQIDVDDKSAEDIIRSALRRAVG